MLNQEHVIFVCSLPRSGSNMLCDLISQVGYKNFGENLIECPIKKKGKLDFTRKSSNVFFHELRIQNYDRIVTKYDAMYLPYFMKREKLNGIKKITVCNHIRKDLVARYVSHALANQSGIFMYAGENADNDDFKSVFPNRFQVSGSDDIEKTKRLRLESLRDEEFIQKVLKRAKKSLSRSIVNKLRSDNSLRECFSDVKITIFKDIIKNPSLIVGDIVGKEVDVKMRTKKQADEASRDLYNIVIESLDDDFASLCTSGWADYFGISNSEINKLKSEIR